MTNQIKYTRIFVGDIARWNRDRQLETCKQYDPELKAIYEPKEFDLYVRNLRSDEVALMARLVAIAERKPKKRPGIAFVLRLIELLEKCAYIQDAQTGIKSTDGQAWLDLVENTYGSITRGRELRKEQAKKLAKLSHEAREPGLVEDWLSDDRAEDRIRMAQHWRDPFIPSAKQAIAQCPDEELRKASVSTWMRIFGPRKAPRKNNK